MARHRWTAILVVLAGLVGILVLQNQGMAMDRPDKKLRGEDFWEALEQAKPLIKARADTALRELGYDPSSLTGLASPTSPDPAIGFGGDETWLVQYWSEPPKDRIQKLTIPGKFRVYLNAVGTVRRVEKGYGDTRELLMGKDRTVRSGMTHAEVGERLGEPDQRRSPTQGESHLGDEVWVYRTNNSRRKKIHVYFADQHVTTTSHAGVAGDFPLNKGLLEGKIGENRKIGDGSDF